MGPRDAECLTDDDERAGAESTGTRNLKLEQPFGQSSRRRTTSTHTSRWSGARGTEHDTGEA